jgi:hypothetical protein
MRRGLSTVYDSKLVEEDRISSLLFKYCIWLRIDFIHVSRFLERALHFGWQARAHWHTATDTQVRFYLPLSSFDFLSL